MPHGIIDGPLNCIEYKGSDVGGVAPIYPVKPLAIFPYDNDSVTAVAADAWNYTDSGAVVHHITVFEGTVAQAFALWDVRTGVPFFAMFIDPTAYALPHTIRLGPVGLRVVHGIGVSCAHADTKVHVYYERIPTR